MPLLWLSVAFIAGILAGKYLPPLRDAFPFLAAGSIAWYVLGLLKHHAWWRKFAPLPPALVLAFLALGGARFAFAQPVFDENTLAWYNDTGSYTLTAWVSEPPDVRESGVYLRMTFLEAETSPEDNLSLFDRRIRGDGLVRFAAGSNFALGDVLRFTAKPLTPSSRADFSYRDYLSRQGIYSVLYNPQSVQRVGTHAVNPMRIWLEDLRQHARSTIFRLFPQPESSLLSGILLGLDNDLPASLAQMYRDTGTAHIIAISGFNMAVIAAMLLLLCSKAFDRYSAYFFTVLGLAFYSMMVGASPSVIRAAVMAVVAMGGHLIGRKSSGPTALGFTAAVMCAFNPMLLWDASFQLSFSATFGLVLFGSPLQAWAERTLGRFVPEEHVQRYAAPLTDYFLLTLAAQIATLPVIAIQFGRLSLSSLLANPLILPVQPAVMALGGIAAIAGMLVKPLGQVVAFFAWPFLAYTNRMVEWISRVAPGAIPIDSRLAVGITVLCVTGFGLFAFRDALKRWLGRLSFAYISLALMAAVLSVWTCLLQQPDGKLHLDLIRAGGAIDLVVASPQGEILVVDPQGNMDELTSAISRALSPFQNTMDAVLLTDRSLADNVAVFGELIPVGQLLLTPSVTLPIENTSPVQVAPSLPQANLETGDSLALGRSVRMDVLASNPQATALLLEYQGCRILIPGGIDPAQLLVLDPRFTSGLTAILLTPADLALVPPSWWSRLDAALLIWKDNSVPPDLSWVNLNGLQSLELISDGLGYSLSVN